jgi:hypothetical protein
LINVGERQHPKPDALEIGQQNAYKKATPEGHLQ